MPGMSNISHHQCMIEFDAAHRETVLVIKKTAANSADTERPDFPFFRFKSDSLETVRVLDE
jgi:hypothetical protein